MTQRSEATLEAALHALHDLIPGAASELRESLDRPVGEYLERRWTESPRQPVDERWRNILDSALLEDLRLRVGSRIAPQALAYFKKYSRFASGFHAQLFLDPATFAGALAAHVGAARAGAQWIFAYQCATVTLEASAGKGPAWAELNGNRVRLLNMPRSQLARTSVCAVAGDRSWALANASEDPTVRGYAALLERVPAQPLLDLIHASNELLWSHWQGDAPSCTRFFAVDERLVARAVVAHLEYPDSPVSLLLCDDTFSTKFHTALRALTTAVASAVPRNLSGLYAIRAQRIRKLVTTATRFYEPASARTYPREPGRLSELIKKGDLVPDLLTTFLVISILPGYDAFGGARQLAYLYFFRQALLTTLNLDNSSTASQTAHAFEYGCYLARGGFPSMLGGPSAGAGRLYELADSESRRLLADSSNDLASLRRSPAWQDQNRAYVA